MSSMSNNSVAFKITNSRANHIRRFTLNSPASLDELKKRVAELYGLQLAEDDRQITFFFTYVDEDGDDVVVTRQDELEMAVQATQGSLVRLTMHPSSLPNRNNDNNKQGNEGNSSAQEQPAINLAKMFEQGVCELMSAARSAKAAHGSKRPCHQGSRKHCRSSCTPRGWGGKMGCPGGSNGAGYQMVEELHALCDNSNTPLRLGKGWFHLPGSNFDLCTEEWNKLDAEQKALFVEVTTRKDLGEEGERYVVRAWRFAPAEDKPKKPCEVEQGNNSGEGEGEGEGEGGEEQEEEQEQEQRDQEMREIEAKKEQELRDMQAREEEAQREALLQAKSLRVVAGPSIAHNTPVQEGDKLVAVWQVENTGEGLWTDVRLKAIGSNPLKARVEGYEVPMLAAHHNGLVSAEVVVPAGLGGQEVDAAFRLFDADGDAFGEELTLNVIVAKPTPVEPEPEPESDLPRLPNEDSLVAVLSSMGFQDERKNRRLLRQTQGDVNSAALELLRGIGQ